VALWAASWTLKRVQPHARHFWSARRRKFDGDLNLPSGVSGASSSALCTKLAHSAQLFSRTANGVEDGSTGELAGVQGGQFGKVDIVWNQPHIRTSAEHATVAATTKRFPHVVNRPEVEVRFVIAPFAVIRGAKCVPHAPRTRAGLVGRRRRVPNRITVLEYSPGGNDERDQKPNRGGVQSLLKREQTEQRLLATPPPTPRNHYCTHTHPDRSDLPGKIGGDCFAPAAQGLT